MNIVIFQCSLVRFESRSFAPEANKKRFFDEIHLNHMNCSQILVSATFCLFLRPATILLLSYFTIYTGDQDIARRSRAGTGNTYSHRGEYSYNYPALVTTSLYQLIGKVKGTGVWLENNFFAQTLTCQARSYDDCVCGASQLRRDTKTIVTKKIIEPDREVYNKTVLKPRKLTGGSTHCHSSLLKNWTFLVRSSTLGAALCELKRPIILWSYRDLLGQKL